MKVFCKAFLYLQFVFVFFWHKEIGEKAGREMLVKVTKQEKTEQRLDQQLPDNLQQRQRAAFVTFANCHILFAP